MTGTKQFISDYKVDPRLYLGGSLSQAQRMPLIEKHLKPLKGVDLGYRHQCRCGYTIYVKFRAWFYCQHCGRRILFPDIENRGTTFREDFAAARESQR